MRTKRHLQKKTVNKKYKKINLTKQIKKQKLKKTRINKLVGGDGDNTVKSKIMICTRNEYTYLIPVLEYLERIYKFMASHIDIIYANNTLLPRLAFPATLNSTTLKKNFRKPQDIFNEAIAMTTHPFIIYIDDENEIIKNNYSKNDFDSKIKKQFYFELYSYNKTEPYKKIEMSSITEDMKKNPNNLSLLKGIINTIKIPASTGLCLCIQLPHENTSICNPLFFYAIKKILSFINKKFNNNLLTAFDFDNTLTNLHLYKSIHPEMEKYTEENQRDFSNAFLKPSSDDLKEEQIVNYFGAGNIEKIISLFEIVKSIKQPANSNQTLPTSSRLQQKKKNSSSTDSPRDNLQEFLEFIITHNSEQKLILSFCNCKIILVYIVYYNLLSVTNPDYLLDLINTQPVKGTGKGASSENIAFISTSVGDILKGLYPALKAEIGIGSCSGYELISGYLHNFEKLYNILFKSFEDKKSIYKKFDDLFLSGGGVKDTKTITLADINKLFTNVTINSAEVAKSEEAATKAEEAAAAPKTEEAATAEVLTIPKEVSVKNLNSALTFTLTRKPTVAGQSFTITKPNIPKHTNTLIPLTKDSLKNKSDNYVIEELALGNRFKVAITQKSNSKLLKSLKSLTKKNNSELLNSPYPIYINKFAEPKIKEYETMEKKTGVFTKNKTAPKRQTLLKDIMTYGFSRQDIEKLIRLQHHMPTILNKLIDGEKIEGMFRVSGSIDKKNSFYTDSNFSLTKEVLDDTYILCSLVKEYIKFLSTVKGSYFEEEIKTNDDLNIAKDTMLTKYLSYYEVVDKDILSKIFVLISLIMNNDTTKMNPEGIGKIFQQNVEPRSTTFPSEKRHSMYKTFFEYIKTTTNSSSNV
jgi:hypothetical protein